VQATLAVPRRRISARVNSKITTIRAALLSAIFALTLAVMVFVPVWFVLSFISRLFTSRIHPVTYGLAGVAAGVFFVFVFRMAFEYFRRGSKREIETVSRF
jgi:inner membrane protein involved in colicin E2 resistance